MTLLHTALRVSDLEKSIMFYEELCSYEIIRQFEKDGVRNVFLGYPDTSGDGAALQLLEANGPIDPGDFVHVALRIKDLEAALASLDEDLIESEPETLADLEIRVAFINDINGWGIELIEQI